jgi:hypothetical protein
MAKGFQVLRFVIVDFEGSWDRHMMVTDYSNIRYTAMDRGGKLAVVVEAPTGLLSTYRYKLAAGEEVWVLDQVIHVPARCIKNEPGNTTKCSG